ncbi:unnamed protein product [Rotaria sp. Silwood2]|nr:unnamed protein product [Rotaria sp. Silwood2]CAF2755720.1 unnamed protein product [Rotaria sp. Silwood2]CAF3152616.1 unnamed protein product [Rotaria sp. Silwood2]CAF3892221.1 unnamed protein product [Rotaria sp. Silwood2]CAF3981734.1 unnamed protein product [Rotaria sp. Silwood2]
MASISPNDSFTIEVNDTESSSVTILFTSVPPIACFWIMLIFLIPSLVCSIFLLYNFFFDRKLRHALNNHVIIALLIVGLFSLLLDVPNYLNFIRLGYVWPQLTIICYLWCFVDLSCFNLLGFLMAWATIERHILVFHNNWINTLKKRFLLHYLPLTIIILYSLSFYTIVIFFSSCENEFDYTQDWCAYPCYSSQKNIMIYDNFFNFVLPTPLIVIVNSLLIIRIVKQKQRLHQHMKWSKYRKMILQIMSCSTIFLLFNLPMLLLLVAHACGLPYEATGQVELFFYFLAYFINISMPFVCLGSLPEIWIKIRRKIKHFTNRVTPENITLRPSTMKQLTFER